jgi:putative protease
VKVCWQHGSAQISSPQELQKALQRGLDYPLLREKLGAWGNTPFELDGLDTTNLEADLFLPLSLLKRLRQDLQEVLQEQLAKLGKKQVLEIEVVAPQAPACEPCQTVLEALVRTPQQLEAAIEAGCAAITLDWMEMVGLNAAVARVRQAGLAVGLATVRVQKPGEECYDRRLQALKPDWLLVRHWGAVTHFARGENRPDQVHGDFSLNVTNSWTASHVLNLGLDTVTVAHDLDQVQLQQLLSSLSPSRLAVTVHHHISTFHTEHCVYSHLLSNGRDYRSCGRPCEEHLVELQDRKQVRHPVIVDVGCRNTVFNGVAQSCTTLVPALMQVGIGRLRLEFVRETGEQTRNVVQAYQQLMAGSLRPDEARSRIGTHEQFGVSLGTMAVLNS